MLIVNEIFTTIQGETSLTGWPMLFVRFTGCPLRCTFCDTAYAYEEGTQMSIDQLMERIRAADMDTIHLTGGEPLIQQDLPQLVDRLLAENHHVVIETGGSRPIVSFCKPGVHIMLDIKTPGSGMDRHNHEENFRFMRSGMDEFKFVICDRSDYKWALDLIRDKELDQSGCVINLSPVFPELEPRTLAAWILEDRLQVRLNCQMHKFVWPDKTRGV